MKKIGVIVIMMFCTLFSYAQPDKAEVETINGKKYYVHIVEQGQTLYAIHQMYNVPVGDISRANENLGDGLQIGQKILVPIPITDEVHYKNHIVQSGETLYGISKQYKCAVSDLKKLNPELANSNEGLQIGQVLKVPNNLYQKPIKSNQTKPDEMIVDDPLVRVDTLKTVFTDSIINHTVLKHETLYAISKRYMVTIASINELNEIKNNKVKPGDVIKIKVKKVSYEIIENPIDYAHDSMKVDTALALVKKEKYKIALFLPLMLSKNDAEMNKPIRAGEIQELYPITKIASGFYHGFMLAADSLSKAGLNADIYIYDTQKDTNVIAQLFKNSEFLNMDLIVGPFYPKTIKFVSDYAQNNKVPMVVPFKAGNSILYQNPYVVKATASNLTLVEGMVDFVSEKHKNHYVTMVKPSLKDDLELYELARQKFNTSEINIKNNKKIVELSLGNVNGRDLNVKLRKDTVNVVIVPSTNLKFISGVFTRLNNVLNLNPYAKNMKIIVYGFEDWNNLDDLDLKHRMRLHQHYVSYRFLDYESLLAKKMILSFRQKYITDPDEYGIQGFDVGYYFMSALHIYGSDFLNYIHNYKVETVQNNFEFSKSEGLNGRENNEIKIVEYQNYQLILHH